MTCRCEHRLVAHDATGCMDPACTCIEGIRFPDELGGGPVPNIDSSLCPECGNATCNPRCSLARLR